MMAIASYTSPSSTILTEDTTVADLSKHTYGTSEPGFIQSIASTNEALFASILDPGEVGTHVLKAGTRIAIPSIPSPGKVNTLALKRDFPPAESVAAITSLPNVREN